MEDAKISQDGLYQQGRYPSIVDTDDLVFELGKQAVDRLNKDKLLDAVLKKSKMLEDALREAVEAKTVAEKAVAEANASVEKEVADIRNSNEQYIENNRKMDAALVEARKELNVQKAEEAQRVQDAVDKQKELTNESEATIVELRAELDDLHDVLKAAEEKASKKRSSKKK